MIEGTERVLAESALEVLLDRLLPADMRELNLARFRPDERATSRALREAVQAMPFLAERRVVVVTGGPDAARRAAPRALGGGRSGSRTATR